MKSEVLANFHLPWLTCIGLVIFFTVFLGVLFWVYRKSAVEIYKRVERLPLQEDHLYE